jgi:hypothetical protein
LVSLYVKFNIEIQNIGNVVVSLSRAKALKIINELSRRVPFRTRVFMRNGFFHIFIGVGKGGFSRVSCREGIVLYDVVQDTLMICLADSKLDSIKYVEIGFVESGLDVIKDLSGSFIATITKIEE